MTKTITKLQMYEKIQFLLIDVLLLSMLLNKSKRKIILIIISNYIYFILEPWSCIIIRLIRGYLVKKKLHVAKHNQSDDLSEVNSCVLIIFYKLKYINNYHKYKKTAVTV